MKVGTGVEVGATAGCWVGMAVGCATGVLVAKTAAPVGLPPEGIGVIGYGSSINLSLLEGQYNLTMRITDSSGNYTEVTVSLSIQKRIDDAPPGKDRKFPWVLVVILSIIILLLLVALLLIIKKRSSRRGEMDLSRGIDGDVVDRIAWENSMNSRIRGPMEQALNDETIHYADYDMDSLERGLKRKRKDGTLTSEEYLELRSFIDGIIEE